MSIATEFIRRPTMILSHVKKITGKLFPKAKPWVTPTWPHYPEYRSYQGVLTTGIVCRNGVVVPRPKNPIYQNVKRCVHAYSLIEAQALLAEWPDLVSIDEVYVFDFNTGYAIKVA